MIKRQLLPLLLLVAVPVFAQTSSGPPPMPRRPSIILIVADGLGYGDLGCYGQRNIKTPNLDRLAAEGVRFTDFYAGSPDADVSRATLLTGRDCGHLGISDDALATLPVGAPTVAEILSQAGYHTCCLGEWGLGQNGSVNVPQKRGFQEWAGLLTDTEARTDFPEFIWRYDPPGEAKNIFDGQVQYSQNANGAKGMSISDVFTAAAGHFMTYAMPDQFNKRRPFFLMIDYSLPRVHDLDSSEPFELEPWPQPEKHKAAAIARLDADIGKIMDKLKATKQESNTFIFVTSIGGPRAEGGVDPKYHKSTGNFRGAGGELLEGGLRVPLIVWGLSNMKSGEENFQPTAAWDLFPTFVEIARWSLPDKVDGISFLPLLRGKPQPSRHEFLFWESHPDRAQAVRFDDWKGVRAKPGAPLELYSLKADQAEKTDLSKEHPDIVTKIDEYLKTKRNEPPQK